MVLIQTKICRKCGIEKSFDEFHFRKDNNKYRNECKLCHNEKWKMYKIENREKVNKGKKLYQESHKEEIKLKNKKYAQENKNSIREYKRKWARNKSQMDPVYKLNSSMRRNINHSLEGKKNGRHWEELVNYTYQDLKQHLEKQFSDGMSWENYGRNGWEIDHRIPLSIFNINGVKSKGFKKAWSLENLQPLWKSDNASKRDKLFVA